MDARNSERQQQQQIFADNLQEIEEFFSRPERNQQYNAAYSLCSLLSSTHPPSIEELKQSNILSKMLRCLRDTKCPQLQLQFSSAFLVISGLSEQHRLHVVQSGALPLFVRLLSCKDLKICEISTSVLANIAKNSRRECDLIVAYGAALPLSVLMCNSKVEVQKAALDVLQQLSLGSPYRIGLLFESNILSYIKLVLFQPQTDVDVLIRTLILLCYIIQEGNRSQQLRVIKADFFPSLIDALRRDNPHVRRVAADTAFELISATDHVTALSSKNITNLLILLCENLFTEELWVLQIIYDLLLLLEKFSIDVSNILQYDSGFNKLKQMQRNSNKQISQLAIDVVEFCKSNSA
uniref:Armadillo repeat-containing protein 8 n=1 Tax=Glossina brevipalpis TaxID=37001 RepID=A0A1A9WM95_9MUSC